jgi:hypothetical protein
MTIKSYPPARLDARPALLSGQRSPNNKHLSLASKASARIWRVLLTKLSLELAKRSKDLQ